MSRDRRASRILAVPKGLDVKRRASFLLSGSSASQLSSKQRQNDDLYMEMFTQDKFSSSNFMGSVSTSLLNIQQLCRHQREWTDALMNNKSVPLDDIGSLTCRFKLQEKLDISILSAANLAKVDKLAKTSKYRTQRTYYSQSSRKHHHTRPLLHSALYRWRLR